MASVFGHAIAAVSIGSVFNNRYTSAKFFLLGIISSIIPDADVIAFNFGIPYANMWGHRGFTHSIFFAIVWTLLMTFLFFKRDKPKIRLIVAIYLFLATISHGLLDAMTTGGRGVAFFAPFDCERIFLPYRFIQVSPIGISNFFSQWGAQVLINELMFIAVPGLILFLLGRLINKRV